MMPPSAGLRRPASYVRPCVPIEYVHTTFNLHLYMVARGHEIWRMVHSPVPQGKRASYDPRRPPRHNEGRIHRRGRVQKGLLSISLTSLYTAFVCHTRELYTIVPLSIPLADNAI